MLELTIVNPELRLNSQSITFDIISSRIFKGDPRKYEELPDKPRINGIDLSGEQNSEDLGLVGEAPIDDQQYARQNGEWKPVESTGGTSDYGNLKNKPKINGHTITGEMTASQLGLEPANPAIVKDSAYVHTDNNYTDEEKDKLSVLANYDDTEVRSEIAALDANKQDVIPDLSTIRSDAAEGASIAAMVPAQASATNQLADKDFVNSSIQNVAAYYITKDAAGNPFNTKAELLAATTFYSGGQVRVPTRNDYLVVLSDESKTIAETGENPTTRYIYGNNVWSYQYIVNRSGLTAAQWAAVNSGITAEEVARLEEVDNNIYPVTCNVTTKAEVDAAVAAGKLPVCIYNDRCYIYSGVSNGYATFLCLQTTNNIVHYYRLYLKTSWGEANIVLAQDGQCEKTNNKVTTLSASSTDTQYPSAKCVHDGLENHEGRISSLENAVTSDYNDLANKPSINGTELTGNKMSDEFGLLGDAPRDGVQYARKNGQWTPIQGGGGGGTSDYNDLENKPSIGGVELEGSKTASELGLQPTIADLDTIRSGAAAGATAVQPESGKGLFSGSYNDLTNKPSIPSAVTESTVASWGFTKNIGTYSKPSSGIPKSDLDPAVQTSLGKADSALQSVPNTYRTASAQDTIDASKYTKPSDGIPESDFAPAVQTKLNASDIFICEYDVTSFEEIEAAYYDGKLCILWNNDMMYQLSQIYIEGAIFTAIDPGTLSHIHRLRVAYPNDWIGDFLELATEESSQAKEDKTNKVTALSASSNDTQYPSAKCVYDLVGNVESLLNALL